MSFSVLKWGIMSEAENYLEEIIEALDFDSLNEFLYGHMRTKMTFEELVAQVSLNGIEALNKENICGLVFDSILYELSVAKPIFIKMLLFSILFSIVHRLLVTKNRYISDVGFLMIYTVLMVLLMQSFFFVKEIALEGINSLITFLNALIPTYAMTLVFTGNSVTGAYLYEIAFFLVYIIELIMKSFLMPLIHVFVLIWFLNNLFDEDKLSKLAELLEKAMGLILKVAFGGVIGLSVVQSLLTPAKDRLADNVLLSGMSSIPGIGGTLGSIGEIIFSCGLLIKNSVGVIGLVILFFISIIPVLKIGCFSLLYHVLSVTLQPIADKRLTECVSGVARGCDLYLKMVLYSMMLFFVLFSIVTVATSFIY